MFEWGQSETPNMVFVLAAAASADPVRIDSIQLKPARRLAAQPGVLRSSGVISAPTQIVSLRNVWKGRERQGPRPHRIIAYFLLPQPRQHNPISKKYRNTDI
jgi:hypothetical protein